MQRILVIEDENDIRQLLRFNLEREGFAVLEAADGLGGLHMATSELPDLVVLDLMLPGLDGRAVASIMEQDDELSGIPIIVTSALVESEHMFQPFPQVKAFCAKPFVLKDLVIKVKQCLDDA